MQIIDNASTTDWNQQMQILTGNFGNLGCLVFKLFNLFNTLALFSAFLSSCDLSIEAELNFLFLFDVLDLVSKSGSC
jgi:hypothetical protein